MSVPTASERLAVLAHEVRSPVAALDALAAAAPGVAEPGARRRIVALAVQAGRDLERLLADPELLSLRREPVELGSLASAFAGPQVTVRIEGRAPVEADATRLRQALSNLVGNGLRHGTHVELVVVARDGAAIVEVSDDGPGVEPGFDPFPRGVSRSGSTGYGLWLARAVAEAHGGSLDLVPGEAPGARFRLALPLSAAAG